MAATSKRLIAIGGVMHGSAVNLEDSQRDHFFRQWNLSNSPQTYNLHRYTRRIVSTTAGIVEYLAPEDWSDLQALQSALGGTQ